VYKIFMVLLLFTSLMGCGTYIHLSVSEDGYEATYTKILASSNLKGFNLVKGPNDEFEIILDSMVTEMEDYTDTMNKVLDVLNTINNGEIIP